MRRQTKKTMTDDASVASSAPQTGRRWLRRLGLAAVFLLAAVAIGFQVQVVQVRDQVDEAESAQRLAELDEDAARFRLESVDDRVEVARTGEADARGVLERSRTDMTAQGLEEAALSEVQHDTATHVKDLRRQNKTVNTAIAELNRLHPAAGACLFDLLRALGRVGGGNSGGSHSQACTTVASHSPGQT